MLRPRRNNIESTWRSQLETLEWKRLLSGLPTLPSASPTTGWPDPQTEGSAQDPAFGATVSSTEGILTSPESGAQLASSPLQLVVNFNQPVSSFDLGFFDVRLDRVNSDGSVTSMFDINSWPSLVANNNDGFDPTFDQITITLDGLLEPGTYHIVIVADSMLSFSLAGEDWDPSQDHVISEFSVIQEPSSDPVLPRPVTDPVVENYQAIAPDASVVGLIDLGSVSGTGASHTQPLGGTVLTPGANVVLYRFSVDQGHYWLLKLAASSTSQSSLSLDLFRVDEGGTLVRVSLTDLSRDFSLTYPSLTGHVGLSAGTYCLAVSEAFSTSAPSTLSSYSAIDVNLSATNADVATRVTTFQLNDAGPYTSSPAGLTIGFSGPVLLSGFAESNKAMPPLEVVDETGKVWDTVPWGYNGEDNRLTLVFSQPLPSGRYSLRIASSGGLTDLAGLTPTAAGLPEGILATWTVGAPSTDPDPSDLGVLWPGDTSPITHVTKVSGTTFESSMFAVVAPGLYKLQAVARLGNASVVIYSSQGTIYFQGYVSGDVLSTNVLLPTGVYTIVWTSGTAKGSEISWSIRTSSIHWESLRNNGVGQWMSLEIPFGGRTNPPPSSSSGNDHSEGTGTDPGSIGETPGRTFENPATSSSQTPTVSARSLPLSPVSRSTIGVPSARIQQVASVGPSVTLGSTAVADTASTLLPGISYGPGQSANSATSLVANSTDDAQVLPASVTISSAKNEVVAESSKAAPPTSEETDRNVLASIDWILEVGDRIQRWFEPATRVEPILSPGDKHSVDPASATLLADWRVDPASKEMASYQLNEVHASLPLGVLVTTALVCRANKPIRAWWRNRERFLKIEDCFGWLRSRLGAREPRLPERKPIPSGRRVFNKPHFAMRRSSTPRPAHAKRSSSSR